MELTGAPLDRRGPRTNGDGCCKVVLEGLLSSCRSLTQLGTPIGLSERVRLHYDYWARCMKDLGLDPNEWPSSPWAFLDIGIPDHIDYRLAPLVSHTGYTAL
ncbi:hypothetical protein NDU88_007617 [Pleurodeles waltl]|uniref:Uncharacterized protein n=1 Tax=Pleurodeles waltl TaxID=8319 RepID=A0AAV7QSE2_PLEWA|nr:hypothetical protein NDU88_007617 [Pleurodeles waltl]